MPAKVATSQTVAGGAFPRKKRQILALNGLMALSSCEVKRREICWTVYSSTDAERCFLWKPVVGPCLLAEDLWLLAPDLGTGESSHGEG